MTDQKCTQRTHTKTCIHQTQYWLRACSEDSKVKIMAQACILEYLSIDSTDVELLTQAIQLVKAVLKRYRGRVCKSNIQETEQRQWQERPHRRWPGYRCEKKEVDYVIRVFLVDDRMFTRRLCACPANSRRFHDLRPYSEDSRWPGWQVVIGIETHAQIRSRRKLFSGTNLAHLHSHLINISTQIPRHQRLILLRIFTCRPLTLLFLEHSPCVLHSESCHLEISRDKF